MSLLYVDLKLGGIVFVLQAHFPSFYCVVIIIELQIEGAQKDILKPCWIFRVRYFALRQPVICICQGGNVNNLVVEFVLKVLLCFFFLESCFKLSYWYL